MALFAHQQKAINEMGGQLRRTLRRADPAMPKSLMRLVVALVKEGLQRRFQGHERIHPGVKKMAKWGDCTGRTAQRHLRVLEADGVAVPLARQKGGRFYATVYGIDYEALVRFLMISRCNPSPALISQIRDLVRAASAVDAVKQHGTNGDTKGDKKGDTKGRHKGRQMSPRIRILSQAAFERDTNVVEFTKPEDRENANG